MAGMNVHEQPQLSPCSDPVRRAEAGPWVIELLPACAYEARYVAQQSAIGFAFDSQSGVHAIGSDRIRPFDAVPNGLAFVPAGCDVFSRSCEGGEYLRVLRKDVLPLAVPEAFNNLIDPQAMRLAQRMRKAFLNASPADDWEAWALSLAQRMAKDQASPAVVRGSMTARRLRLLDEYIDAGLSEPISVQDMANLLALSEGYFMRVFAQSTGKSPHSYLIDCRVARARTLLRDSKQRLADIAQACGFASQAHMATTFKQRLGVSPMAMRT
ncbi:AraC family transcriptional regulator [Pseudomonas sp. LP_7_YM]|uniref:helix-turn-helix transcriptional regulator n=1 Tax=Pseudomonas sp. LP_7_YM TaxID=2485137 RepID=UPI001061F5FD|nr:AraC family transcriptional regulator [Pseudomonas sp. LP_7_YM]